MTPASPCCAAHFKTRSVTSKSSGIGVPTFRDFPPAPPLTGTTTGTGELFWGFERVSVTVSELFNCATQEHEDGMVPRTFSTAFHWFGFSGGFHSRCFLIQTHLV